MSMTTTTRKKVVFTLETTTVRKPTLVHGKDQNFKKIGNNTCKIRTTKTTTIAHIRDQNPKNHNISLCS